MLLRQSLRSSEKSAVRRGVSLIDMTVTMMILGILAAAAVPRMTRSLFSYQADAAAARIAADLEHVAKYARTKGRAETVTFDTARERYTCTTIRHPNSPLDIYSVDLSEYPYSGTIERVSFGGQTSVTFDGYGFPDADGKVVIRVGNSTRTVKLYQATGNVEAGGDQ